MSLTLPKFITKRFAASGQKNDIPIDSVSSSDGLAAYDVGFPAVTMVPKMAGGKPPRGRDFNGILYDLSSGMQYSQVGMHYPFNQAFCDAIGGYPKGAIILGIDGVTLWQSTIDSNTTDPDSAGAKGWSKIVDSAGLVKFMSDRFAFVYPNGGSEASPANITVNQRYVIPSPFPGHQFYSVPEIFYNNMWGDPKFIWYLKNMNTATGIGAATSQVSDNIILVTGANGFLGTPNHQGHPFGDPIPPITSVPCRIKVWRID